MLERRRRIFGIAMLLVAGSLSGCPQNEDVEIVKNPSTIITVSELTQDPTSYMGELLFVKGMLVVDDGRLYLRSNERRTNELSVEISLGSIAALEAVENCLNRRVMVTGSPRRRPTSPDIEIRPEAMQEIEALKSWSMKECFSSYEEARRAN